MTTTPTSTVEAMAMEAQILAFIGRKYVQRNDARQEAMGLIYTTAETHDLAKEIATFVLALHPSIAAVISGEAVVVPRVVARPECEWSEDMGDVLWWKFPIEEAPHVGSPLDLGFQVAARLYNQYGEEIGVTHSNVGGWPGYHTHFTPLPAPPASPYAPPAPAGEPA